MINLKAEVSSLVPQKWGDTLESGYIFYLVFDYS